MENDDKGFSPPYNIPWATFLHTVEKVAADLPNRVDRSYLSSRSGNEQTYLISAFRGFGLINDDYTVTETLRDLAQEPHDQWPAHFAAMLARLYPKAVELGRTNATGGELEQAFNDMFPTVSGASRVKAIRFYLAACEYTGTPKSPLWKAPKASPASGTRRARGKKNTGGTGDNGHTPPPPTPNTGKDMKQAYFDLLLKKAEAQEELDADLLDRIEKLLAEQN